jgi:hypothetical protein
MSINHARLCCSYSHLEGFPWVSPAILTWVTGPHWEKKFFKPKEIQCNIIKILCMHRKK